MRIHLYDFTSKNKKAIIETDEFLGVDANHTIDDFSSMQITFSEAPSMIATPVQAFDNIYLEDDDGEIIFGGVVTGYQMKPTGGVLTAFDHRWVLSRLILDEARDVSADDDILDTVEDLINVAKSKRLIPITFDRENSAINPDYSTDLRFEVGDDIASAIQKIIQNIYARWAVRYYITGNEIYGNLVIRSVRGVTPEGVGISRSPHQSEDGEIIELFYGQGDQRNNIEDYTFVFDLSQYTSRAKVGTNIGGETNYYTAPPTPLSSQFEYFFGRAEGYVSDYKLNSEAAALASSQINQTLARQDFEMTLSPNFKKRLNCGDRVSVVIETPLLETGEGVVVSARIDSVTYSIKDGSLERKVFVNTMSPQKRTGTFGFLQAMSEMQQRLDGLDKNYLINTD